MIVSAKARVSPKVVHATKPCARERRHTRTMVGIRIKLAIAAMTMALRIARGSSASTLANGRNASTASPVTAPLQRVRAPAMRFNALRVNDPPTGIPLTSPAARLAAP